MSNTNMEMIDSTLKGILHRTKGKKVLKGDLNDAMLLLIHLCGYRKWALPNDKKRVRGSLCIGGVVTPILKACRVPLKELGLEPRLMEHDKVGDFYRYKFEHPSSRTANILLPCTKASTILEGENIDFEPALEDLYFESGPVTDENVPTTEATEDEIVETDEDREEEYGTSMYDFGEHVPLARHSKSLSEAHRNNNLL